MQRCESWMDTALHGSWLNRFDYYKYVLATYYCRKSGDGGGWQGRCAPRLSRKGRKRDQMSLMMATSRTAVGHTARQASRSRAEILQPGIWPLDVLRRRLFAAAQAADVWCFMPSASSTADTLLSPAGATPQQLSTKSIIVMSGGMCSMASTHFVVSRHANCRRRARRSPRARRMPQIHTRTRYPGPPLESHSIRTARGVI